MLSKPDFIEKKVILIFSKSGDKLSFKNDNLIVSDIDGKVKFQISCYRIFQYLLWVDLI